MSLKGKVAFITGSSKNMGKHFADILSKDGADIVIHHHSDSSKQQASETGELVKNNGSQYLIVQGDLSNLSNIRDMFVQTVNKFGKVDIVINNAGEVLKKPFIEISEQEYDRVFGINAKAAFFVMQEAAKYIADGGRIINLGTSLLGVTTPFYSAYAGSKAPLEHFTRAMAHELGHRGITVNTIAPGPIDTSFFHGQETPDSVALFTHLVPANRLGQTDDIAPVVKFLASDGSKWISGQTIFINGALTAR